MRKISMITTAALVFGFGTSVSANGTVKPKKPEHCPPVTKHHYVHHKHHHAQACPPQPCAPAIKGGFYIGAKAGWGYSWNKIKSSFFRPGETIAAQNDHSTVAANGVLGGIYAGYDWLFSNQALLGVELGAKLTHLRGKESARSPVFETKRIHTRDSYDLTARIGRVVHTSYLPYAKIGAELTRYKFINSNPTASPFSENSKHKFRTGFLLGAGIEVAVTPSVTLGAEYTFTYYQRLKASYQANDGTFYHYHIRPVNNTITARVSYKM